MNSSTATYTVTARYATLTHTPGHTNTIAMSTPHDDHDEHTHGHSHGLVDESIKRSRKGVRTVTLVLGILASTAAVQALVFAFTDSLALLADLIHNGRDAPRADQPGNKALHLGWVVFCTSRTDAARAIQLQGGHSDADDARAAIHTAPRQVV